MELISDQVWIFGSEKSANCILMALASISISRIRGIVLANVCREDLVTIRLDLNRKSNWSFSQFQDKMIIVSRISR